MKRICIFCGAGAGKNPIYREKARELGNRIAEENWELVYGGSGIGIMGEIADGVLEKGGFVRGVLPEFLFKKEVGHSRIQELEIVDSMHVRKLKMYEKADAFLVLPGGIGTLDEFFEVFTWSQLTLHEKPILIYNINHYYNKLISFLSDTVKEGFFTQDVLDRLVLSDNLDEIFETLKSVSTNKTTESEEEKYF